MKKIPQELIDSAEEELDRFEAWFQKEQGEAPLSRFERAILKTYIVAKSVGVLSAPKLKGTYQGPHDSYDCDTHLP